MILRDADAGDHGAIDALIAAAFGRPDEARLVERLRADGDAAIELVAHEEQGEEPAGIGGHILFSPMAAPFAALGLAPLAVHPDRQRRGIGSALVREGLARARAAGCDAVFVLGDPAYYRRFGFSAGTAAGFSSPFAGPHLMALALGPPLPVSSGTIDHARAFAEIG